MGATPALWSFVGVYFNQDWPEDYGSESASIEAFLDNAPEDRPALVSEIEWLLEKYQSEADLAEYLEGQGNEYLPPADRGGYRGWLMRIAERVRAATEQA